MVLLCDNHSATLVRRFSVESYVKLMYLRSRRASLISSDLAALVKFFLPKNASIVSVKVNLTSCPSKSAQSLAVIFWVAFLTFCEASQCGACRRDNEPCQKHAPTDEYSSSQKKQWTLSKTRTD